MAVNAVLDAIEILDREFGVIGPFGHLLTKWPIRAFVSALPRTDTLVGDEHS